MLRRPTKEALEAALKAHPRVHHASLRGKEVVRDTGVLVPLFLGDETRTLLTERPATMRHHAGEVSFPGGKPEVGDLDLAHTARREANEETGLRTVTMLGELSSMPLLTSAHRLHPFVALAEEVEIVPSPDEVARVVMLSLPELYGRGVVDAIPWKNEEDEDLAPVFETGGRLVFGATAYVLYELLVALAPAFDAKIPERIAGRYTWDDALRT